MARFDKLEFDSEGSARRDELATPDEEQDERYWVGVAEQHRRSGHYENALRFYSRALERDRSLVSAWVGQVQMLVHLHEYPQASLWGRKALELFPNQPDLLAGQAQAECRQGNWKRAHALSDGALQQSGESSYRWQVRGELMLAQRQRTAHSCFDKAAILDNDWLVSLETALIYMHYRNYSHAMRHAQSAVEKEPTAAYSWYVLGCCQSKAGFDSSAERSWSRCTELSPGHSAARQRLSEVAERPGALSRLVRRLWGDRQGP